MKARKIRNIPLNICSAEQKIAYNLAFAHSDTFRAEFVDLSDTNPASVKEFCRNAAARMIEWYRMGYQYRPGHYNEETILHALTAGLPQYMKKPFIASDYEAIGKAFPILEEGEAAYVS